MQNNLFYYFSQALPPAAFQLVSKTLNEIIKNSGGGKLTLGIVLALWSGAGGMTSLISGLNAAYHVRESRSFVKVRLIAVGLTLAVSILVVAALFVVLMGGNAAEFIGAKLNLGDVTILAWKVLQWPVSFAAMFIAFSLVYYFGPNLEYRKWYWVTPGSAAGVALWLISSLGFRLYLHYFNRYTATYGSLGTVIILMLWLYITGFAILTGGEINAVIESADKKRMEFQDKLRVIKQGTLAA